MISFDVDTALSEVPVNIAPLTDDTDFKTIETAVAYNAAGMALYWHFVTCAGAYTATAVTPTTAGVYDWTHQQQGMYTIEIPASGGASINNDTEGFGWFTGFVTGVLPFRSPTFCFRAAALNDALIEGGDNLDVNVAQWLGTAVATPTTAGVPEVDVTFVGGTAQTAGDLAALITAVDNFVDTEIAAIISELAKVPKSDGTASWNATALAAIQQEAEDALAAYDGPTDTEMVAAFTEIKGSTWATTDTLEAIRDRGDSAWLTATGFATHSASDVWAAATRTLTANTNLNDPTAAAIADAILDEALSGHTTAGTLGKAVADILEDTGTTLPATLSTMDGKLDAIDNYIDTEIATLISELAKVPKSDGSVTWNATALASIEAEAEDALQLTVPDSVPADGTRPSVQQAAYMITQLLTEGAISGTGWNVYKPDGTTVLFAIVLDSGSTPTTKTRSS